MECCLAHLSLLHRRVSNRCVLTQPNVPRHVWSKVWVHAHEPVHLLGHSRLDRRPDPLSSVRHLAPPNDLPSADVQEVVRSQVATHLRLGWLLAHRIANVHDDCLWVYIHEASSRERQGYLRRFWWHQKGCRVSVLGCSLDLWLAQSVKRACRSQKSWQR